MTRQAIGMTRGAVSAYNARMQTQALPGFRDFYPADLALRTHIFRTWRTVATRYGFEEYDGPPLEPLDLYTTKSGDEIVGQLYNFTDKGDRQVALRPEMTPTLARMVAAQAGKLRKPIRWFSIPQLFRYERQQRGRLREHFQLNCDLIGEPGPLADAEVIALAIDVLRAFGLGVTDFRVKISDRRVIAALLTALGLNEDQKAVMYQVLDKFIRVPEEVSMRRLADAGIPEKKVQSILGLSRTGNWQALENGGEGFQAALGALEPLKEVRATLERMDVGDYVDLDLSIVRGLAYYTGTVFEIFDAKRTLRAVCGGGRYDNLLDAVGGVPLPAVGFGMGDVVLGELLKDRGQVPSDSASIDVFLAFITRDDLPHVLRLAHQLRDAGLRAEYSLSAQGVGKQLKLADARNARLAIVVGPDEWAKGEVMIKDLRSGSQESVALNSLVNTIKPRLHG